IDAVVSGVGAFLSCSGIGVHMHIDKTGCEIEPAQGDGLDGIWRLNVRCNVNDLAVLDGYVHDAIAMILGVEHMAAGEHKIVFVLAPGKRQERGKLRKSRRRRKLRRLGGGSLRRSNARAEYACECERCNPERAPDN